MSRLREPADADHAIPPDPPRFPAPRGGDGGVRRGGDARIRSIGSIGRRGIKTGLPVGDRRRPWRGGAGRSGGGR